MWVAGHKGSRFPGNRKVSVFSGSRCFLSLSSPDSGFVGSRMHGLREEEAGLSWLSWSGDPRCPASHFLGAGRTSAGQHEGRVGSSPGRG